MCASEANEGGRGACRRRRRLATDNGRCAEAKEAQIEDKLAKERARDKAVSGIKHKQEARKAAKVGKKQQLKQTLKANLKEAGRSKNKARKSGKSKAEEAGGDAQEGEGAAHDKKRRRVSWGQDQERERCGVSAGGAGDGFAAKRASTSISTTNRTKYVNSIRNRALFHLHPSTLCANQFLS